MKKLTYAKAGIIVLLVLLAARRRHARVQHAQNNIYRPLVDKSAVGADVLLEPSSTVSQRKSRVSSLGV